MRLFITSYQKSGTHQIMPIFGHGLKDVVDRSANEFIHMPEYLGMSKEPNENGILETCNNLAIFPESSFGHITYLPEYAQAIQAQPTKVLFNIRDPRDVVIAEYENGRKCYANDRPELALWNFLDKETGIMTFDKEDVIAELIKFAAARWPQWLGWLDHDFILPVKYEELRLKPEEVCQKMIDWLHPFQPFPCHDVKLMAKRSKPRKKNPTFRRGVPFEWMEQFTPKHVRMAEDLLGDIIIRLGYEI